MRPFRLALIGMATIFCICVCVRPTIAVGQNVGNANEKPDHLSRYIDPFIGVDGGGHDSGNVFPGPALPFGMVRPGPDTDQNNNAGYTSTGKILGFSQLHVSGTGGGPKYGVILLAPTTSALQVKDYGSDRTEESASVGYFAVTLIRYGVKAELAATRHAAFHRYTFAHGGESHILVDLGHFLSSAFIPETQRFVGGSIAFTSNDQVEGVGRYAGGWNHGPEYRVFFCAQFDTAAESHGTWKSALVREGSNSETAEQGEALGAFLDYTTKPGQVVNARIGISFIDTHQACHNVLSEIPDWNLERIRKATVGAWDSVLSRITVETESESLKRSFYTALYHSMLMPSDRTGENPKWQSSEPYYDDYYTLWDTFRCMNPLLSLIQEEREVDLIRSLVDIYRHEGYMPDGRSGNANGVTQGGSNAEVLIADAFVKGLKGIDYSIAFQAMLKDAEVPPFNDRQEGRGGLADYNAKGYVSLAFPRSASRTVEYSYDDFAIAQVAKGLGRMNAYRKYMERAKNWENLWDASSKEGPVHGFIRPKTSQGTWLVPFIKTKAGSWDDYFYEADSWEYSLYVPQDISRLIKKSGGHERFVQRLDLLFDKGHVDIGDEPAFLDPMLYLWAGRPDRTADRVRQLLDSHFNSSRSGLPGNDDSGAMSSWFVFQAIGFYPNAGQDVYLIGTPSFRKVTIRLENGDDFVVVANKLDPEHHNRYVQSALLNGQPLARAWFRHSDICNGGVLVLNMGDRPSDWGTQFPPPSTSN